MAKVLEKAGGFLLEPKLPLNDRGEYAFGAGLFLTALWAGFVLLLFFAPFSIWLYAGLLLVTLVVLARSPESGVVGLIVTTMLFESFFTLQETVVGEQSYKFYLIDALLLLTFGAYLFGERFKGFKLNKADWAVLGLDALLAVYFVASFALPGVDMALAFSAFKTYAFYSVLYFLVRRLLARPNGLLALERAFMAGGFGILFFLVFGLLAGQGLWVGATPLSTAGSRILAPTHAFYALFPLLLVLTKPVAPGAPAWWPRLKMALSWLWTFGIVFSLARHLWLVLAAQMAMLWRFLPGLRRHLTAYSRWPLALGLVGLVAILMLTFSAPALVQNGTLGEGVGSVLERAKSLFSSDDVSINWRKTLWAEGWQNLIDRPLFGLGLGRELNFQLSATNFTVAVRELHNSVFALLVQTGLVGGAVFGWLLWRLFRPVKWHLRRAVVPAVALTGVVLASLFGTYFEANFLIVFFWISAAWLASARIPYPVTSIP